MPKRNKNAINIMARKLNLSSFSRWKLSEDTYILDNWEITPDSIMSDKLGRTQRSVKWRREYLGCFRIDKDKSNYESISKFLRANNIEWKKESMKECNYQCVLTGSKNFQIHHLYSVSSILRDINKKYTSLLKDSFDNYTTKELEDILEIFILEQSKYPLGECVDKKIHSQFHSQYGQYYNNPIQWEKFKKEYSTGIYNKIA